MPSDNEILAVQKAFNEVFEAIVDLPVDSKLNVLRGVGMSLGHCIEHIP